MTIDISGAFGGLLGALRAFVAWMQSTYIGSDDYHVSVFALALTALAVGLIITWFVPWGGDDEDD